MNIHGRGAMKLAVIKGSKALYYRKYKGLDSNAINVAGESILALNGSSGKLPEMATKACL